MGSYISTQKAAPAEGTKDWVWASLLTNAAYLPGILTLHDSLRRAGTRYAFVALTTDALPQPARDALAARGIPTVAVDALQPARGHEYGADTRFVDSWTKLAVFGLTQYARVTLLDSDMLVMPAARGGRIDELMETDLSLPDTPENNIPGGKLPGKAVLAAAPACTCNPLRKAHYPPSWVPSNCAYTAQHGDPDAAQTTPPSRGPLALLNSGTMVVEPSAEVYGEICALLADPAAPTDDMAFPDQDLLAHLYGDRWVVLPYVYNALKTLRGRGVHDAIWRDGEVRVVHYILSPKPWDEVVEGRFTGTDETHGWWVEADNLRKREESERGIDDGN